MTPKAARCVGVSECVLKKAHRILFVCLFELITNELKYSTMDLISLISRAIERQKPVSFEYIKLGKVLGKRYGYPHSLFIHNTTNNLMMHIFQISGVSDSKNKLPGWRTPILKNIDSIDVLEEEKSFKIANGYDPSSSMYIKVISKI